MKDKYVFKSKKDFKNWIIIGNVFAKSLCPVQEVLKQYNGLSASQRLSIKKQFLECDNIRRKKIQEADLSALEIGIMVDQHNIASDYKNDQLTDVLSINHI